MDSLNDLNGIVATGAGAVTTLVLTVMYLRKKYASDTAEIAHSDKASAHAQAENDFYVKITTEMNRLSKRIEYLEKYRFRLERENTRHRSRILELERTMRKHGLQPPGDDAAYAAEDAAEDAAAGADTAPD